MWFPRPASLLWGNPSSNWLMRNYKGKAPFPQSGTNLKCYFRSKPPVASVTVFPETPSQSCCQLCLLTTFCCHSLDSFPISFLHSFFFSTCRNSDWRQYSEGEYGNDGAHADSLRFSLLRSSGAKGWVETGGCTIQCKTSSLDLEMKI